MNGLELSREYFETYGRKMLEEEFPETLPYLAVGLVGSGSEALGFDDEMSQDHDFEPGFCIFLPDETIVDRKEAFRLERAYAKLPKEFMGFKRNLVNPVGGARHGVFRTAEFYTDKAGTDGSDLTIEDWFRLPSYALREATDGEVFIDNYGEFTSIREMLLAMPEDVRLKKLAGHLLLMAQAGQYNYPRIAKRGEKGAAQLAIFEFVKSTLEAVFLLNHEYMPFYKWSFRAMRDLLFLSELEEPLCSLMTNGNEPENIKKKLVQIERICASIIGELQRQDITNAVCSEMEKHAYSVNDHISDSEIRNLHILFAV